MEAQLVLIGGRSAVPNLLTILDQRPSVVLALTSHESSADFLKFKGLVEKFLPSCIVEALPPVDAFDPQGIERSCESAFQRYPEANWICNITAATAIMSIAVYEQAKRLQNACQYLNTSRSRVIALVGPKLDPEHEKNLFHLTVEQYIAAYYYSLKEGSLEERRDLCEQQWLPFAQMLGKKPALAVHLRAIMKIIGPNKPKSDQPKGYTMEGLSSGECDMLEIAGQFGLVSKLRKISNSLKFTLTHIQQSFLNGGWLEVYIWDEARKLGIFDDCQWNHQISIAGVERELDVAITYKAQLLIVECKTGDDSFEAETLHKLVSKASPLGEKFVGKILISSLPSHSKDEHSYLEFIAKAKHHRVVVILAEKLPDVGSWLKKEAVEPEFPRI